MASHDNRSNWNGGTSPMNSEYGKLMMWFFLLSDAFTFTTLILSYGVIRTKHLQFAGLSEDFVPSQEYWPIPDQIFNAFPFFSWISFTINFCWFNDFYFNIK